MNLITGGEDLLKAAATASGEGLTAARREIGKKMKHARTALTDASRPVFDMTRKSAAFADDQVHSNAWTAVGVAVLVGVLIGFLTAKR